ncbi:hypothetical protein PLEOSDRAFT_1095812 [Pleurotus ostreatus PC15]|uniref:Uncharacterized protein n=1 Tax=Pleurotus ostreatus (strain PC15) TaxID=1137138 RepID=A0A067NZ83_PLEO1|nr:hypothetical protein PLEOSDRAFT_1095812 [Pleurotus ostreatus PC15]
MSTSRSLTLACLETNGQTGSSNLQASIPQYLQARPPLKTGWQTDVNSEIALGRQHARYSKTFEKENPNWFPWPDKEAEIQRRCGIRSLRFEGLWSFIPSYFNLKMFGQSYIIANARQLGFDNIIGFNAREKVLREAIKLKCSTARAQLRTNIIHTISGKKRYPLDRAAVFLAEKLKRGGVTNKLKVEYILRVALLRRFASDDAQEDTRRGKQQHEQDEEDTAGDDSDGERPTKRKKKNTFWDRRDAYIADKIKRNGNQMDNAGWKLNLVQQDIEQWGPLDGHRFPIIRKTCQQCKKPTIFSTAGIRCFCLFLRSFDSFPTSATPICNVSGS